MIEWALVSLVLMALVLTLDHAAGQVGRAWDRWRHPGEYPWQRDYRRWRQTLERHSPSAPYRLSTVTAVSERPGGLGFVPSQAKPDLSPTAAATLNSGHMPE